MSNTGTVEQANSLRITWFAHMEAWEKSGETQRAFCYEHNLSYTTFGYWRKQYSGKKWSSHKPAVNKVETGLALHKPPVPGFVTLEPLPHQSRLPTISASTAVQARLGDLSLALPVLMPVMDMALLLRAQGGRHAD